MHLLIHNSLSESTFTSRRFLLGSALLLAFGHAVFLWSEISGEVLFVSGEMVLWIATIPLLLIGLLDYRAAILLSVIAIPVFHVPPIPHFFTQGLGDLFGFTAIVGYLIRRVLLPSEMRHLLNGSQLVLVLPISAALISILFNLNTSNEVQWGGVKFQIAEFAGITLGCFYALLLASTIRCDKDFRLLISAVLVSLTLSVAYGLVSIGLMSMCKPDLSGTIMSRGGQVSGGFGNPNYYGSWILFLLPLVLYQLGNQRLSLSRSTAYAIVLMISLLLLLLTVSRSTLLTLICMLLVWGCIAKGKVCKLKVMAVVLTLAVFFPAAWNLRYEKCSQDRDTTLADYILRTNSLAFIQSGVAGNFLHGKTTQKLQVQLNESGYEHPHRMQLLMFSWEAWQSSPFFGIGPGSLASMVRDRTGIGERAHNVIATVLAEQGVVGLLAWLVLWVAVLWRIWRTVWGCADSRPHHVVYGKYLFLIFLSLSTTSLFADQYRVIWLWLFMGLVFSPYFSADDRASVVLTNNVPESSG